MAILVTGGAGYIGSHTLLPLLAAGYEIIVLDNLSNSCFEPIRRVCQISDRDLDFVRGDICDKELLHDLFKRYSIDAVLHFAGLKAVGESVYHPLRYYENNVRGTLALLQVMADSGIYKLVFSSSATVYGEPNVMPISESCVVGHPANPYGRSKLIVEEMLRDLVVSDPRWHFAILRYFNPIGAHVSGLIGEAPSGIPNNLLPYIAQVASGKLSELVVFGGDYPTHDGTGVRDYIHVSDLAEGHLRALQAIHSRPGVHVWNLGTGQGYSVLEIIRAFEVASGCTVPFRIASRRKGDIAICYADPSKAHSELGWKASRGLDDMMRDTWRWQRMNPDGFST